jgi:probable F420-dependent oxidoreductase
LQIIERPFRFGVQVSESRTRAAWADQARRAEALGYDILVMPDHLGDQFAIGPALAIAAEATTSLRIGTFVLQNDLRHPVFVAQEAASLDVLSNGRFELGLGAGGSWLPDYEQTRIPFDPPGIRVKRLEESLRIISGLFTEGSVTFAGQHYTITNLDGLPKPIQRPHPPILVGGGGPRMLSLAAREANIVSILPRMLPAGGAFRMEESTAEAVATKVALLQRLAGARFAELELNVLIQQVEITDDARGVSEKLHPVWAPMTPEQMRETPFLLIGTVDEIVETLRTRRSQLAISYLVVFERDMEAFAPVVARLANT